MRAWLSVLLTVEVGLLCCGCGRPAAAPVTSAPAVAKASEPAASADEVLQDVSTYYAEMQAFQVDVVETMSLDRGASSELAADRMAAVLARPNRISLPGAEAGSLAFHADGQQLWTVLGDRYSVVACPETMTRIAEDPRRSALLRLSSRFLLSLFSDDAQAAIMRDVETISRGEDQLLDGQQTIHLRFTQAEFDWEMWVARDEPRCVQQVVFDMTKQLGGVLSGEQETRITTTVRFVNWRIDPELDATTFVYQPGDGARQVKHVMSAQP